MEEWRMRLEPEWNSEKNAPLTFNEMTRGSKRKVWWKCKHGHEWIAMFSNRVRGSGCPYCQGSRPSKNWNLAVCFPEIAAEWHPTLNVGGVPEMILPHSNRRAWWRCKEGHEWQAVINNRTTSGTGCPVCSGNKAKESGRDLMTLFPEIAEQWHPTLNGELKPTDVHSMSNRKVWWICKEGHEWQATVYHRVEGHGCPYCCGQKPIVGQTDLATLAPALAKEWHPTKNNHLLPTDVTLKSQKKVWWICENGHEWQTTVSKRVNGSGCPVCNNRQVLAGYNDLLTIAPELAAQWHPSKNGELTPAMILPWHNGKVWWQCEKGHEWQASPHNRMAGRGCPFCNQHRVISDETSLATVNPELAFQWNYEKNETSPEFVSAYSNLKYWWKCDKGHEWKATPANRMNGRACPFCNHNKVIPGVNSLSTVKPEVAQQWDRDMNGYLTPDDVTPFSKKKVWWNCEHGHKWKAVVASRSNGSGCPMCRNQKQKSRRYLP